MKEVFFSPAKVNLFFRVLKKRQDGFHDIATLMQAISLGDFLVFELYNKKGADVLKSNAPFLPLDHSNLIFKALALFKEATGIKDFHIHVTLDKQIPIMSGLGGGSSNAATTLWALNKLLKTKISTAKLRELGAALGSDVPFFFSSGIARCGGRGEKIQACEACDLDDFWILKPKNIQLSTSLVYQHCIPNVLTHEDPKNFFQSFKENNPVFLNELEFSAFKLVPKLKAFKAQMYSCGFRHVMMTGSGSAFIAFGHPKNLHSSIWRQKVSPLFKRKNAWFEKE